MERRTGIQRIPVYAVILAVALAALSPIPPATASPSNAQTGRLELVVQLGGSNIAPQCTGTAVNTVTGRAFMLKLAPDGRLVTDLPPGPYMVMVMLADSLESAMSNPVLPAMLNVAIEPGRTVSQSVTLGSMGMDAGDSGIGEGEMEDWGQGEFGGWEQEGLNDLVQGGLENRSQGGLDGWLPGAKVDVDRVPTGDEIRELAQLYHDRYCGKLSSDERTLVQRQARAIDRGEALLPKSVCEVTTAAASLAASGASKAASVALAARAVMAMPTHVLSLDNLGAILHLIDEIPDSVTVLLAARALDPESPMILTNLANCMYDLGDLSRAESFYNAALHSDSEFGPALFGLGKVCAQRGQWDRVLDLMMKSAQMGYCSSVRNAYEKAYDEVVADSDNPPPKPPPWRGAPSAPGAAGTGRAGGTGRSGFGVPKLGNWSSLEELAGSLQDLSRVLEQLQEEYRIVVAQDQALIASLRQAGGSANRPANISQLSFEKQQFHLMLLNRYFEGVVRKAMDRADRAADIAHWNDVYMGIANRYAAQMMAAAGSDEAAARVQAAFCSEMAAFCRARFADRKTIWAMLSEAAVPALYDYWYFSEGVLNTIYDPRVYRAEELARREAVNRMLTAIIDETIALGALPTAHSDCPHCGGTGVVPSPVGDAKVPEGDDDKCPFKGGKKLVFPIGPLEYKVGCTEIELELMAGVGGSVTWDFKHKRVTNIFVGVGGDTDGPVKLGGKFGAEITFDEDGGVSSISSKASASTSMGFGLSAEAETGSGLIAGIGPLEMPSEF